MGDDGVMDVGKIYLFLYGLGWKQVGLLLKVIVGLELGGVYCRGEIRLRVVGIIFGVYS